MLKFTCRVAVLLLAMLAFTANAADADWYQVEIVVFANSESAGGGEVWPTDPGLPSPQNAQHLAAAGSGGAYALLPDGQLTLGGVVAALRSAGGHRPILHIGWRQPVLERGKAQPVWIDGGAQRYLPDGHSANEITGSLLLTRSRFLHVWTDLLYTAAGPQAGSYRMQDHRRMRSGELHYIDHPKFGLLILCTPIAAKQ